jgi:hypothetical protein
MSGKTLSCRFIDGESKISLELTNATDQPLKTVEILTVFLKDLVTPGGGPSQAHISFDSVSAIRPRENVVVPHKTWINGKVVLDGDNQLARLKSVSGEVNPYVLDISWVDREGKTRYQRIPVGH